VNPHHGKIEDAVVRAVIQHTDGIKLQADVVGLDLTALIDTSSLPRMECNIRPPFSFRCKRTDPSDDSVGRPNLYAA